MSSTNTTLSAPQAAKIACDDRLPVTVLSGFLGAGKTSVLQTLLHSTEHGLKIAVIVNDMAAVNLDAKAVVKIAPKLVAMQNGCICCTLREDLLKQVTELAKTRETDGSRTWDYLVIESTGISEPLPVAQTFVMEVQEEHHDHDHEEDQEVPFIEEMEEVEEMDQMEAEEKKDSEEEAMPTLTENPLLKFARLDTMVTVVDACSFFDKMAEIERVRDQPDAEGDEEEERTLADLMVDQVEFANVILLNKCDTMISKHKQKELDAVEQLLRILNPNATVVRTNYGKITHDKILNTHLFNMEKAVRSAGWLAELAKPAHTPETEEYGVSSLVFRANKPFHPTRLNNILNGFGKAQDEASLFEGVIRSKGQVWLANALSCGFMWHSAGYNFGIEPSPNPYIATIIEKALKVPYLGKCRSPEKILNAVIDVFGKDAGILEEIERLKDCGQWTEEFGDRSQELVLIGVHLDKPQMKVQLEKALLTDEELNAGLKNFDTWKSMEDPFFDGKCAEMHWELPPWVVHTEKGEEDQETEPQ